MPLSLLKNFSTPLLILGLTLGSLPTTSRAEEVKTVRSITEFKYEAQGETLEFMLEIKLGPEGSKLADSYAVYAKNAKETEWQIFKPALENISIRKFSYTQDDSPNTPFRSDVKAEFITEQASRRAQAIGLSYHNRHGGIETPYSLIGKYDRVKVAATHPHLLISKRDPASKEITPKNAKAAQSTSVHEWAKGRVTIEEGKRKFTFSEEAARITITRDDGLKVSFPSEKTTIVSTITLEDGILSLGGNSRRIDLREFESEVRMIGDTFEVPAVKSAEGGNIDVLDLFERTFPDLVEQERIKIRSGSAIELEDELSPVSKKILANLKIRKSVKLLGPAGSGKTSEMKELARLVALGKVPGTPRTLQIRLVSLMDLQAGTKYVGELESRLQSILAFSKAQNPILVMDEFHVASSLGMSSNNPVNAVQNLKPGLESGEIRIVAISTNQEWSNAFSSDIAFDQRFEEVAVQAPSGEELVRRIRNSFKSRSIAVPDDRAIRKAIELSDRFAISGAQPRKAVNLLLSASSLMDELGQEGRPASIEAVEKAALDRYKVDPVFFDSRAVLPRIAGMKKALQSEIVGQSDAIEAITKLWMAKMTNVGAENFANTILFYGPPGTGKTLTASLSAKTGGYKSVSIEMNKYATGDIEAFRYEIYRALLESPNTVIILDEFEKAHPVVQNSILSMLQPGSFTVNFKTSGGQHIFEEVRSANAIFCITTNAGRSLFAGSPAANAIPEPAARIGFRMRGAESASPSPRVQSAQAPNTPRPQLLDEAVRQVLVQDGISEPVLSRATLVGMPRPSAAEFRVGLERGLETVLSRESTRHGVKFVLSGKEALIENLMRTYHPGETDFRNVTHLMRERIEPLISQAIIDDRFTGAKSVEIAWSPEIDVSLLPTVERCKFLLFSRSASKKKPGTTVRKARSKGASAQGT